MYAVLRSDKNQTLFTLSSMVGDDIVTLIGLDSIIEYAEENGINITNLYKFI